MSAPSNNYRLTPCSWQLMCCNLHICQGLINLTLERNENVLSVLRVRKRVEGIVFLHNMGITPLKFFHQWRKAAVHLFLSVLQLWKLQALASFRKTLLTIDFMTSSVVGILHKLLVLHKIIHCC